MNSPDIRVESPHINLENSIMLEIDGLQGERRRQVLRSSLTAFDPDKPPSAHREYPPRAQQARIAAAALKRWTLQRLSARRSAGCSGLTLPPDVYSGRDTHRALYMGIGTAGSTSLVLQTVFLPLSFADSGHQHHYHRRHACSLGACYHYLSYTGCRLCAGWL